MWKYLGDMPIGYATIAGQAGMFVKAFVILTLGWWAGHQLGKFAHRALVRVRVDPILLQPTSNLVSWSVRIFGAAMALGELGIQVASIMAVLGAAGLAIALALQGTMQNIAAGVMLIVLRPFQVGDLVELDAGQMASVNHVGLFSSVFLRVDGATVFVPNSKLWGASISSFGMDAGRRIDIGISIGYDDSVVAAIAAIEAVFHQSPNIWRDREHFAVVDSYEHSAVSLKVRAWTSTRTYWETRWWLLAAVRQAVEAVGCHIPYPIRELHMIAGDARGSLPPKAIQGEECGMGATGTRAVARNHDDRPDQHRVAL